MKTLLLLLVTVFVSFHSLEVFAINFDVIGPCSKKPAYSGSFKTDISENVGKISMDIFEANNIPFIGNENGMHTIMGTKVGDEVIEIISETTMRVYGWCFSINGFIPDVLPSQTYVAKQNDYLSWFYAFSTYNRGVWTDYCAPANEIMPAQFCK